MSGQPMKRVVRGAPAQESPFCIDKCIRGIGINESATRHAAKT
jgi:hypothetical protein